MRSWGWDLIQYTLYPYKTKRRVQRCMYTEGNPCGDTGRRWPSASQGERPREKTNLLVPWSWTSILQNCKKTNFCCLNRLAVSSWRSSPTNTSKKGLRLLTIQLWGDGKVDWSMLRNKQEMSKERQGAKLTLLRNLNVKEKTRDRMINCRNVGFQDY